MDQEAMVAATLHPDRIKAGEALVRLLDQRDLRADAAFWLYEPQAQSWKLYLAERTLRSSGPKTLYGKVQKSLRRLAEPYRASISLEDVALVAPDAPIVMLLKSAVRTGPGISGVRFTNNVINGTLIDDAYIYRVG